MFENYFYLLRNRMGNQQPRLFFNILKRVRFNDYSRCWEVDKFLTNFYQNGWHFLRKLLYCIDTFINIYKYAKSNFRKIFRIKSITRTN